MASIVSLLHPAGASYDVFSDGSNVLNGGTSTAGTASGSIDTLTLGDDATGNNQLHGLMSEVILYEAALSTSEREQVEGYLACKWGTQAALPSGHPYESTCP